MGTFHHCRHDSHCAPDGRMDEQHPSARSLKPPASASCSDGRAPRRPVGSRASAWSAAFTWSGTDLAWAVIVHGFVASVLPVASAGAARLSLGVSQDRDDSRAGHGHRGADAADEASGGDPVHRRDGPGLCGQAVPVRLHHDLPAAPYRDSTRPDLERHDSKAREARRATSE